MRARPFVLPSLALSLAAAAYAGYPGTSSGKPATAAAAPLEEVTKQGGAVTENSVYLGTVIFTCVNADAAGTGPHTLDRDNTGAGLEALRVDITDGFGTLIYTLNFANVLGTFAGGIGDFFYTTPPAANPLTFTLTSLAGNGLPEQIDFVAEGGCSGLPDWPGIPTLRPAGVAVFGALLLGIGFLAIRRLRQAG
jgi:hypothetical protein